MWNTSAFWCLTEEMTGTTVVAAGSLCASADVVLLVTLTHLDACELYTGHHVWLTQSAALVIALPRVPPIHASNEAYTLRDACVYTCTCLTSIACSGPILRSIRCSHTSMQRRALQWTGRPSRRACWPQATAKSTSMYGHHRTAAVGRWGQCSC